jgi:hypothetical protein
MCKLEASLSIQCPHRELSLDKPVAAGDMSALSISIRGGKAMHEHLDTPYHQQDTDYYCGAACAQMVLSTVGAGLLDQDDLYADNHSHSTTESGWATAPDGLYWTLNNRQSQTYFALDALDTEDAISRMIAWTIHHYRVAPIAMVFGSAHWIAVRGFTGTAAPNSSTDTAYSIEGFDVNNPWPPTPAPGPPPPHAVGDVCGSGGSRGVADEHLSYATWQADYMTGIDFGHWNGKFVALCDPAPPPKRLPERIKVPRPPREKRLLDAEAAAELATRALHEVGLSKRDEWGEALTDVRPGRPSLIQRLDRLDSFYWMVPMDREGRTTAAVSIDARSGEYRQAIRLPESDIEVGRFADEDEVLSRVIGERFELPDLEGRLLAREEAVSVYPHYVWRPCLQSLSPFYPFRMITIGRHRLYIRLDGPVFTSLRLGVHGI